MADKVGANDSGLDVNHDGSQGPAEQDEIVQVSKSNDHQVIEPSHGEQNLIQEELEPSQKLQEPNHSCQVSSPSRSQDGHGPEAGPQAGSASDAHSSGAMCSLVLDDHAGPASDILPRAPADLGVNDQKKFYEELFFTHFERRSDLCTPRWDGQEILIGMPTAGRRIADVDKQRLVESLPAEKLLAYTRFWSSLNGEDVDSFWFDAELLNMCRRTAAGYLHANFAAQKHKRTMNDVQFYNSGNQSGNIIAKVNSIGLNVRNSLDLMQRILLYQFMKGKTMHVAVIGAILFKIEYIVVKSVIEMSGGQATYLNWFTLPVKFSNIDALHRLSNPLVITTDVILNTVDHLELHAMRLYKSINQILKERRERPAPRAQGEATPFWVEDPQVFRVRMNQ